MTIVEKLKDEIKELKIKYSNPEYYVACGVSIIIAALMVTARTIYVEKDKPKIVSTTDKSIYNCVVSDVVHRREEKLLCSDKNSGMRQIEQTDYTRFVFTTPDGKQMYFERPGNMNLDSLLKSYPSALGPTRSKVYLTIRERVINYRKKKQTWNDTSYNTSYSITGHLYPDDVPIRLLR